MNTIQFPEFRAADPVDDCAALAAYADMARTLTIAIAEAESRQALRSAQAETSGVSPVIIAAIDGAHAHHRESMLSALHRLYTDAADFISRIDDA